MWGSRPLEDAVLYFHGTMASERTGFENYDSGLTGSELLAMIDRATERDSVGNEYVNVLILNLMVVGVLDADTAGAVGAAPDLNAAGSGKVLGMSVADWTLIAVFVIVVAVAGFLISKFMFQVYEERGRIGRLYSKAEAPVYRGARAGDGMNWKVYLLSVLMFNLIGFIALFLVLMFQDYLPMNPQNFGGMDADLAFNTAVSFVTNTNWQAYGGESTLSVFSQMFGLTVQNFLSAATGIAVLIALIRGIRNRSVNDLGNFWKDVTKATAVLLPVAFVIGMVLVSQGVPQTFDDSVEADLMFPYEDDDGELIDTQTICYGPMASQEAIKTLGTNGGGYMNANSSHPFENPNETTNITEMAAIFVIPTAVCLLFGSMVHDRRQGLAILGVMTVIFVAFFGLCVSSELAGNPGLDGFDEVSQEYTDYQYGGNLEGKELRFGTVGSSLFAIVTTATSCGAVNSMHDSYTAMGGMAPMLMMMLGEVCFGGVGSGLYGMLMFVIIAVFIAGLMVGRMPEYLGKKIGPKEMRIAAVAIITPVMFILAGSALAILWPGALDSLNNPGAHGFSEILYAFASATGNNGSAFAGLNANTGFFNIALGICMLAGRFIPIALTMALAGSLSEKKIVPPSNGTLPTHTPTFMAWLFGVVMLVGVLSFFLCLSLGPIAEMLM